MKTALLILILQFIGCLSFANEAIQVGSKAFTEGYLLGELAAQQLQSADFAVQLHSGMGGTGILFQALSAGDIDLYPEYTGTIAEAILKRPDLTNVQEIGAELKKLHLVMSPSLGFTNSYALAVRKETAEHFHLKNISDLKSADLNLKAAFSSEFVTRKDGWSALAQRYSLELKNLRSLEHSLAFEAIGSGSADLIDVYSTDAKIDKFNLILLNDDLGFFPRYEAVWLAREDFVTGHPAAWTLLLKFAGQITAETMRKLNAEVDLGGKSFQSTVATFLRASKANLLPEQKSAANGFLDREISRRTLEHIYLVLVSLFCACILGLPLGVLSAYKPRVAQLILGTASILQTIPSLALLCFLIPVSGIGQTTAELALFAYALLPIVLNTYTGLRSIDPALRESAQALGLSFGERLRLIELPLIQPQLLAGIRTSAITSIGTATLAALIGAGGLGVPIVAGLAINDHKTILSGAIPVALLALLTNFVLARFSRRSHL